MVGPRLVEITGWSGPSEKLVDEDPGAAPRIPVHDTTGLTLQHRLQGGVIGFGQLSIVRAEHDALAAIPYQSNEVVLHTDDSLLPRKRLAWSSWNYWLREQQQQSAVLNYNMNILQGLQADTTFCVTLNASDAIDESRIIERFSYSHPVFSLAGIDAASRIQSFNGLNRSWFAGAWLGNGFHEDGVVSGRRVAEAINRIAAGEGQPAASAELVDA